MSERVKPIGLINFRRGDPAGAELADPYRTASAGELPGE